MRELLDLNAAVGERCTPSPIFIHAGTSYEPGPGVLKRRGMSGQLRAKGDGGLKAQEAKKAAEKATHRRASLKVWTTAAVSLFFESVALPRAIENYT